MEFRYSHHRLNSDQTTDSYLQYLSTNLLLEKHCDNWLKMEIIGIQLQLHGLFA